MAYDPPLDFDGPGVEAGRTTVEGTGFEGSASTDCRNPGTVNCSPNGLPRCPILRGPPLGPPPQYLLPTENI